MRIAPETMLTDEERTKLTGVARSKLTSVLLVQRARIVELAVSGLQNKGIVERFGIGGVQGSRWRGRYALSGQAGIERDLPRGVLPLKMGAARLVELTTQGAPLAAAHWSSRKKVAELGVSASAVMRHWRACGLRSHIVGGFTMSHDPKFVEKLEDVVGLYMSSPGRVLVLWCVGKCQSQALDRAQPGLPLKRARTAIMIYDYKYNGTTALNVLDGQVVVQCQQRHSHTEWLKFLRKIDCETLKHKTLHLIADNYATHKPPAVQDCLAKHVRFMSTSASWLNLVERFFRDIATEPLRRSASTSMPELVDTINGYIAHHNTNPRLFIWTKSGRDILQKVIRANRRLSSKQSGTLH